MGTDRYTARRRRFAGSLLFAGHRLAPDYDDRRSFEVRMEQAARDIRVRGLSSSDWRAVVSAATAAAWQHRGQQSLLPEIAPGFDAAGYRAVVARDRCGCGHQRRAHAALGGSTGRCNSCRCGAYALAGPSPALVP